MDGNLVFGVLALLFGLGTLVARFVAPNAGMFAKLEPMRQRLGPRLGTAIHVVAYTVMPLVAGAVIVGSALLR